MEDGVGGDTRAEEMEEMEEDVDVCEDPFRISIRRDPLDHHMATTHMTPRGHIILTYPEPISFMRHKNLRSKL